MDLSIIAWIAPGAIAILGCVVLVVYHALTGGSFGTTATAYPPGHANIESRRPDHMPERTPES